MAGVLWLHWKSIGVVLFNGTLFGRLTQPYGSFCDVRFLMELGLAYTAPTEPANERNSRFILCSYLEEALGIL